MNICIGGPWHGSKLLTHGKHEKFFQVKDSHSKLSSSYFKKKVKVKNAIYTFWVSDEIMDYEAQELIKKYLHEKFIFID